MKKQRQLLLRFRHITQQEIDDLHCESSDSPPEFEDARAPRALLASQLKDLSAALAFVEREVARRILRKAFH